MSDDLKILRDFAEGAPLTRTAMIDAVKRDLLKLIARVEAPVPLILHCPMCHARHVDEGSQATTPHRTHACQNPRCGHLWAPAVVATVGVWTLPGCLNPPTVSDHDWIQLYPDSNVQRCLRCSAQRRPAGDGWQHRYHSAAPVWIDGSTPACSKATGGGADTRTGNGEHAIERKCPTCLSAVGEKCSVVMGLTTPPTVGDLDERFHEERCRR